MLDSFDGDTPVTAFVICSNNKAWVCDEVRSGLDARSLVLSRRGEGGFPTCDNLRRGGEGVMGESESEISSTYFVAFFVFFGVCAFVSSSRAELRTAAIFFGRPGLAFAAGDVATELSFFGRPRGRVGDA